MMIPCTETPKPRTNKTVTLESLGQAVTKTGEFTLTTLTDISSQTGTGKVQGVDEAQRSGTSSTTGGQVTCEITPELSVLVNTTQENLFVHILEGEVQSLSWEV